VYYYYQTVNIWELPEPTFYRQDTRYPFYHSTNRIKAVQSYQ